MHPGSPRLILGRKLWKRAAESKEACDEALRVISEAEAKMAPAGATTRTEGVTFRRQVGFQSRPSPSLTRNDAAPLVAKPQRSDLEIQH